ncbi:MAG: acylphosphatase [Chloroflexi bacterium]|nr:acylphosphatase [Chloroflexota bacterium]
MTPAPRQRLEATVRGRVQGVGFRWFVQRTAERLGLAGWVANRPDRSVEVVAEGDRAALDALLAALHDGPPAGRVDLVEHHLGPARGEPSGFRIRSGSHPGD